MTEEQLIQMIQSEKTRDQGFRILLSQYKEKVYWHIRRMVHEHADADDVVQNTFIKVFKNLGSFKGQSKLYTWIYRIATNESLTYLSKMKRIQSPIVNNDIENPELQKLTSENTLDSGDIINTFLSALRTLPPKQKAVFNMKYFDNMSYREMSEVMGTSEGGLKASYFHASNKIKELLKQSEFLY